MGHSQGVKPLRERDNGRRPNEVIQSLAGESVLHLGFVRFGGYDATQSQRSSKSSKGAFTALEIRVASLLGRFRFPVRPNREFPPKRLKPLRDLRSNLARASRIAENSLCSAPNRENQTETGSLVTASTTIIAIYQ